MASDRPILVDSRAGSCDLILHSPLKELGCLCHLDSADVCFTGQGESGPVLVGVEVKSAFDLIASLNTGRLQAEQIPKMIAQYDVNWLLCYGHYRPSPDDGVTLQIRKRVQGKKSAVWTDYKIGNRPVPYGYVESFLCSPSFTNTGILSKHAHDITEAVAWIGVLYRTWQKDYSKHKSMRTFDKSRELTQAAYQRIALGQAVDSRVTPLPGAGLDEKEFQCATTANTFPAVGFERAVAVGKHFKSVRTMVNAGPVEWAKVDGIGPVIARKVEEAIK